MKLAVIGGGGVRSMFLAKSLVQSAKTTGISEIVFMDNNETKLRIYGGMAKQVAERIDKDVKFALTSDAVEAVRGAAYVITTIRVGEDEMRVKDERTALNRGLLGQETTGAAGFSFAMRSVPALREYCELIKKYSKPGVKVFNFTNPAGVVSQTLRDMGYDFTYGICDAPSSLLHDFAALYGKSQDEITGECYGLNHLSFFSSIKLCGREIMPELIEDERIYHKTEMRFFEPELVKKQGCILNEYLYYFYYREKAIANILGAGKTRGEIICEINREMTKELSGMDIENDFDECLNIFEKWYGKREGAYMANETGVANDKPPFKFDIYSKDEGGYAGVALKYIKAARGNADTQMILCVPNNGAIKSLKDDDVIEVTCDLVNGECVPHKFGELNEINLELIRRVKLYERLASKAIREQSIDAAIDCLMVHPLVNSYSLARDLVKEYLEINKKYSGEWK